MSSGSDTSGVEDDDEYFDIVDDDDSISDDDIEEDDNNNSIQQQQQQQQNRQIINNNSNNSNNNMNNNNNNNNSSNNNNDSMDDSLDSDDSELDDVDDDDYEYDIDDDYEPELDNTDDHEFLVDDQDEDELDQDNLTEQSISFLQLLNTLNRLTSGPQIRFMQNDQLGPQQREMQLKLQQDRHQKDLTDIKDEKITLQCLSRLKDDNIPLERYLFNRELSDKNSERIRVSQYFLPSSPLNIRNVQYKIFCCKLSSDGKIFMSASQDKLIRFFDTSSWQEIKTIEARDISWSIIDTDYSPDQNWLVYSSWSPFIQLVKVNNDNDLDSEVPLPPKNNDFVDTPFKKSKKNHDDIHEGLFLDPEADRFCVFGLKFSPNNKEILAGSSDGLVFIYDLIDRRNAIQIKGHKDDINSVTYLDRGGNLFATGSDDTLIKIWDKRIIDDSSNRPIGVLTGHINGVTHVTSKEDGVYLLSNSKDQSAKLWDIRRMKTQASYCDLSYSPPYDKNSQWNPNRQLLPTKSQLENDISLMTYKGHKVFQTLIRCYFSPLESTGQKYIYSGSADGRIFIYDVLSGENIRILDQGQGVIRDLAWSPCSQELISGSWHGYITKWDDWNDIRFNNNDDYYY